MYVCIIAFRYQTYTNQTCKKDLHELLAFHGQRSSNPGSRHRHATAKYKCSELRVTYVASFNLVRLLLSPRSLVDSLVAVFASTCKRKHNPELELKS